MKVAIVGGGISGLYLAFKLINHDSIDHIDLFEASNRLGGRIHTIIMDNIPLEGGAGRINMRHRHTLHLINELGLGHLIFEYPKSSKKYVKNGKVKNFPGDKLLRDAFSTFTKNHSKSYLKSVTLECALRTIYNEETVDDIIYYLGYDREITSNNAYDAIEGLKRDLLEDQTYIGLNTGLTTIIDKLGTILRSSKKVRIHLNKNMDYSMLSKQYDKVIDCTNRNTVGDARSGSLARVYARFPTNWFNDIGRITTNNQIRQFIPIDYNKNIVMASYCTDKWAEYWSTIRGDDVKKTLVANLRKVFPKHKIPEPTWVKMFYWDIGAHYWPPRSRHNMHLAESSKCNIYFAGEKYSKYHHGWIEGALESCESLLKIINI